MRRMSQVKFVVGRLVRRRFGPRLTVTLSSSRARRALRSAEGWKGSTLILFTASLIGCAVFAASDEFHQSFVPSRTSSMNDVIIDICGAAIALAICVALASRNVFKQNRA